jgi:hypothetical protein
MLAMWRGGVDMAEAAAGATARVSEARRRDLSERHVTYLQVARRESSIGRARLCRLCRFVDWSRRRARLVASSCSIGRARLRRCVVLNHLALPLEEDLS